MATSAALNPGQGHAPGSCPRVTRGYVTGWSMLGPRVIGHGQDKTSSLALTSKV
jgi:hypothetical protein